MTSSERHDRLIRDLVASLRPVRRLPPPGVQAVFWLGVVGAMAAVLAMVSDLAPIRDRLAAVPDMWLAAAGSALTAVLAAAAVFHLGRPDRSPAWALLPLPAVALWIGASGLGCLRAWAIPGLTPATLGEEKTCLLFILGVSAPLSALLLAMLRRAFPLQPGLALAMAGLAAAAASATLLNFVHPYDAGATDLAVHIAAVAVVVVANNVLGGAVLRGGAPAAVP